MATIDDQRAGRRAVREGRRVKSTADKNEPDVGWTAQSGRAQPKRPGSPGVIQAEADRTATNVSAAEQVVARRDAAKAAAAAAEEVEEVVETDTDDDTDAFTAEELGEMTVADLKELAEDEGIDLDGATKKADIIDALLG